MPPFEAITYRYFQKTADPSVIFNVLLVALISYRHVHSRLWFYSVEAEARVTLLESVFFSLSQMKSVYKFAV